MSAEVQFAATCEAMEAWLTAMGLPARDITVFAIECCRTMDTKKHPGGWHGRIVAEYMTGGSTVLLAPPHVEVVVPDAPPANGEVAPLNPGDEVERFHGQSASGALENMRVGLLGEPVDEFDTEDVF